MSPRRIGLRKASEQLWESSEHETKLTLDVAAVLRAIGQGHAVRLERRSEEAADAMTPPGAARTRG